MYENVAVADTTDSYEEIEARVAEIWREVFGLDVIGPGDEFYALGGNSLYSISLVSKTNKALGVDVSLAELLKISELTIKNMAEYVWTVLSNDQGRQTEVAAVGACHTAEEAEQRITGRFGRACRLVRSRAGEKTYTILYLEGDDPESESDLSSFLSQNMAKDLLPHYIRPLADLAVPDMPPTVMGEEELVDALHLKRGDAGDFLTGILAEIDAGEKVFQKGIASKKATNAYASSPVQTGQVEQPFSVVGTIIEYDEYLDKNILEKSICKLIGRNGLLRSVLQEENDGMTWREYGPPDAVQLPFLDLSAYDAASIEAGVVELIKKWYLKNFTKFNSLMYRILLVKRNLREYVLFFPIHFTIFDGASSGILQRGLKRYYAEFQQGVDVPEVPGASYADYIEQISKGPLEITEDAIIEEFNLAEYNRTLTAFNDSLKSKTASPTFIPYLCDVEFGAGDRDIKNEWELTYGLFNILCKEFFDARAIPAGIVGYGRRYEQNRYFDTMGELVDSIPYVIPLDDLNFKDNSEDVQKKFAIAQNHNINFMSFLHNTKIRKKWRGVIDLVYPSRNDIEYPFIFNFQGRLDYDIMAMRDTFEPLRYKSYMDHYKSRLENNINDNPISLFFNAFFIGNVLKINITTHYIREKETLRQLFDGAISTINRDYGSRLHLKRLDSYGMSV